MNEFWTRVKVWLSDDANVFKLVVGALGLIMLGAMLTALFGSPDADAQTMQDNGYVCGSTTDMEAWLHSQYLEDEQHHVAFTDDSDVTHYVEFWSSAATGTWSILRSAKNQVDEAGWCVIASGVDVDRGRAVWEALVAGIRDRFGHSYGSAPGGQRVLPAAFLREYAI